MKNKTVYSEPRDYFPKEIRKAYKLGEFSEDERLQKIKAVMLGHAVGDALGVPVEFFSREELRKTPVTDMIGWSSHPVAEGCWSDDTSMALATLDSLANGGINYNDIMNNFAAWLNCGKYTATGEVFDIGRTCMKAIRRYLASDGKDATQSGLCGENYNGNGSLMRIHPMALYLYCTGRADEGNIEVLHSTSALTHAHEISKIACGIYAFVLWELLDNPSRPSIFRGLERAATFYKGYEAFAVYDETLIKKIGAPKASGGETVTVDDVKSSGYVVDTLEAAIWCVLTTADYKECVLKAVNLGEDTDTVAAVAGGLAGALYGLDQIPQAWLQILKRRKYIESTCETAYKSWLEECVAI